MASISRDFTNPMNVLIKIDDLIEVCSSAIKSDTQLIYSDNVHGELHLTDESLGFDSREELQEQLERVSTNDVHSFVLWVTADAKKKISSLQKARLNYFYFTEKEPT